MSPFSQISASLRFPSPSIHNRRRRRRRRRRRDDDHRIATNRCHDGGRWTCRGRPRRGREYPPGPGTRMRVRGTDRAARPRSWTTMALPWTSNCTRAATMRRRKTTSMLTRLQLVFDGISDIERAQLPHRERPPVSRISIRMYALIPRREAIHGPRAPQIRGITNRLSEAYPLPNDDVRR